MLPNPLHPAVVHFPIVLAVLLPILAAGAIWAIRRGARSRRAWTIPMAGALALAASAWVAVETGEQQEERVERVVAEAPLNSHAEMAEAFLGASCVLALVAAAGWLGGTPGRVARIATTIGAAALVVSAARVGHSGGQLVYRYGAATAYTGVQPSGAVTRARTNGIAARSARADDDER